MAHVVTCAICRERFDRDKIQAVKHNGRTYSHYSCEPDKELVPMPPDPRTQDEKDIDAIKKYCKELYGESYNSRKVNNQLKDFHDNDKYTYSGILKTLVYHFEVKHGDVSKAMGGIGIVPYLYIEARDYYLGLFLAQQANINKDVKEYTTKVKEIQIRAPKQKNYEPKLFSFDFEEDDLDEE